MTTGETYGGGARMATARGRSGFTFLEVLFSIVVMAVVMIAVQGLFASGTRHQEEAVARVARVRRLDRVRDLVAADLRGALLGGGPLASRLDGGTESVNERYPGHLEFVTTTARYGTDAAGADLQRVEYTVETAERADQTGGVLHRTLHRILLAPTEDDTIGPALIDGVSELETEFYDGVQWLTSWSSEESEDERPLAVRVRVHWERARGETAARPPLEVVEAWPTSPSGALNTNVLAAAAGGLGGGAAGVGGSAP